jgi:hypothetical protein
VTGSRRKLEGGHNRILKGDWLDVVLEVQLERLLEALQRAVDRVCLARHLNLEAACNEPIAFVGDRGRELHAQSIGLGCDGNPRDLPPPTVAGSASQSRRYGIPLLPSTRLAGAE